MPLLQRELQRKSSRPKRSGKLQTVAELRRLQRLAGGVIMRSLDGEDRTQSKWIDGRDINDVVGGFIKPNDRLTSLERIEIYNRQYWFRLIDSFYDDYPGLLAILGREKFNRLAREYIAKYPSRSFTLRNLGQSLARFLAEEPKWAAPHEEMALDMARFESAQVEAFDGPNRPPITPDDLAGRDPAKLRLKLQPYITLIEMAYPLDDFSLAIKRQGMRTEASNAMSEGGHEGKIKKVRLPRRRKTFVAVHRHENDLYFNRLEPAAFGLLKALSEGEPLAKACEAAAGAGSSGAATAKKISAWFTNWTAMGWFCK